MNAPENNSSTKSFRVEEHSRKNGAVRDDVVAVEEPMEIRLVFGPDEKRSMRSLSVTMRTPGQDADLAAGFLFTEGILEAPEQIASIEHRGVDGDGVPTNNIVRVNLRPDVEVDFQRIQRNFMTNSSCGVCGKASLESLDVKGIEPLPFGTPAFNADIVYLLPDALRMGQPTFAKTGGIHAAGFANNDGELLETREDIGRHNAVDKLIGSQFLKKSLPVSQAAIVVSGRASFEIVQKAIVAGVPIMIAVGAPSSLAVELAAKYQMTLIGFASSRRFNVYTDVGRIQGMPS